MANVSSVGDPLNFIDLHKKREKKKKALAGNCSPPNNSAAASKSASVSIPQCTALACKDSGACDTCRPWEAPPSAWAGGEKTYI